MLRETVPDFRDAVVDGFAFAPESLTGVASPGTLDKIIENCLAIQLDDHELARDLYADLRERVLHGQPRRYDSRVSVALSPWQEESVSGPAMFTATVKWEYRLVPVSPVMRFACVSDLAEYRELLHDPSMTAVWYFEPVKALDGSQLEVFQLLRCSVNERQLTSRRAVRAKSQIVTVNLGDEVVAAGRPVTLSYAFRVLVQQHSHLLHLDVAQPTKGLHVQFSYQDCGIRYVSVLDYLSGVQGPRISQLPAGDPTPSVEIDFDRWVLPKGGVAFVWVLEGEGGFAVYDQGPQ